MPDVLPWLILLLELQCPPLSDLLLIRPIAFQASVTVEGSIVSSIGPGAMALVGIHEDDTKEDLEYCCKRLLACKLWENDSGAPWRHGLKQRGLEILCVSQFTLYGKLTKKNQPDYKHAMKAIQAQEMYNMFLELLKSNYESEKIRDGVFGAYMDVSLVNDGPVTIVIESEAYTKTNQGDKTESTDQKSEKSS